MLVLFGLGKRLKLALFLLVFLLDSSSNTPLLITGNLSSSILLTWASAALSQLLVTLSSAGRNPVIV